MFQKDNNSTIKQLTADACICFFFIHLGGSPPVVEDTTNTIDTTLGSSVSFDCSYTSLWDAVVQWVHITPNRISIINDTLEPVLYSQSPHSVGTVTKSTLHITSFNSSDVGSYQCQVTNQFGTGMSKNNTLKKHKSEFIFILTLYCIFSEELTYLFFFSMLWLVCCLSLILSRICQFISDL